ncbi:IS3 family transposase [Actinomyces trachealis]|uniref:IS3 family transposase n=1 Tax=Actinomyces trachealis TaxID=2763540 RepID=UPI0018C50A5D
MECGFITSRGDLAAKARPASARAVRDEILRPEIERVHAQHYSVYGVGKRHHAMVRAGWQVGRDHVARPMRLAGVQGVRRGRRSPHAPPACRISP